MQLEQLVETSYQGSVIAAVIVLLILVGLTNFGIVRNIRDLRENPDRKRSVLNTVSRIAAGWIGFFVIVAAASLGGIYAVSVQQSENMQQSRVSEWLSLDYGIDNIDYPNPDSDTVLADRDNQPREKEIITGLMDRQRISFYVHAGPSGEVHPMIIDREIPMIYPSDEK